MKTKTLYATFLLLIIYSCNTDSNLQYPDPMHDLTLNNLVSINSNIPQDFYNDLTFTSEKTGYAISRLGKIIKTTDAGITWTSLNSTVNFYLKKIQFVSANIGYVIGGDNTGSYLLKTINSGQTWSVINLNTIEKGSPAGMFFKNENEGYINGNKFFIKTTNGGLTWTNVLTNTTEVFNEVKFRDFNFGIATTSKSNYYKTTNGGISWQSVDLINNTNLLQSHFLYYKTYIKSGNKLVDIDGGPSITLPNPVNKLQFIDATKCIGIGQHYEAGLLPYGDILVTNTSWNTFQQKTYQPTTDVMDFTAMAIMSNHKIMILGTGQINTKVILFTF